MKNNLSWAASLGLTISLVSALIFMSLMTQADTNELRDKYAFIAGLNMIFMFVFFFMRVRYYLLEAKGKITFSSNSNKLLKAIETNSFIIIVGDKKIKARINKSVLAIYGDEKDPVIKDIKQIYTKKGLRGLKEKFDIVYA